MAEVRIQMGAFAPNFRDQLRSIGLTDESAIERYALIEKSLSVVFLHGVVSESAVNKGRDRLFKRIMKDVAATTATAKHKEPLS